MRLPTLILKKWRETITNDFDVLLLRFIFQSIPYERLVSGSNPQIFLSSSSCLCLLTRSSFIHSPCREDPANERPPSNDYSVKISMTNFLYFPLPLPVSGLSLGQIRPLLPHINDPSTLGARITGLRPEHRYRFIVWARTRQGRGEANFVDIMTAKGTRKFLMLKWRERSKRRWGDKEYKINQPFTALLMA